MFLNFYISFICKNVGICPNPMIVNLICECEILFIFRSNKRAMIKELFFLVFHIIHHGCGMRLEAYWEASYVLPRTEECWKPRPPKTVSPYIDLKMNVPWDFPTNDLIINIAFADFDVDR